MNIDTKRLRLRQPHRADAERLALLGDDPVLDRNMEHTPHPKSESDALAFIDDCKAEWQLPVASGRTFVIEHRESGEVIGLGRLMREGQDLEVGFWLGADYRGKGFATEAVRALIDYGFKHTQAGAIVAYFRVDNPDSYIVQEKCGMRYKGLFVEGYDLQGELIDVGYCTISRYQWLMSGRSEGVRRPAV